MRWLRIGMAALVLALLPASPASAKCPGKVLGRDARGDAPNSADLVGLMVMRCGPDLWIVFNVSEVSPASPIYAVVHAGWTFKVDRRTFMVEAETGHGSGFELSKVVGGEVRRIDTVRGSYETLNDFIGVMIPMGLVGADEGSLVAGVQQTEEDDVKFRLEVGLVATELDSMATSKTFVIPRWG